jgi:hypothetical protein
MKRALGCALALTALLLSASWEAGAVCKPQYDVKTGDYHAVCQERFGTESRALNAMGTSSNRRGNSDQLEDFYRSESRKGYSTNFASGEICSGTGLDRFCLGGDDSGQARVHCSSSRTGCR